MRRKLQVCESYIIWKETNWNLILSHRDHTYAIVWKHEEHQYLCFDGWAEKDV
jgi:hypothetical protein